LRKRTTNTLTETADLVHRHSVVSEKFSNFLRTSAGISGRYEAVNAMLLNEFLKAHRRIEEQEATIARLQKQIDAVTADLEKVSAQIEAGRAAPRADDVLTAFVELKTAVRERELSYASKRAIA
jgi:hypothetical protein